MIEFADDDERFETGWTYARQGGGWCIRETGAPQTLCGLLVNARSSRRTGWFAHPPMGPSNEANAHAECVRLYLAMKDAPETPTVDSPEEA
ncbi:hypothetical protein Ade02nite_19220 [Paractinoplanes deccanensis]|uniref:Uncharacterized protein n=1 Tax=Paractinoplanes deccanensis TaxID=113561 RepID=A0ABQ3XZV5_9ACTN|nr:hypothetical protein [Actinoplanes deccanensis]GID73281.1 hypothetical protein Ade02nite_19220 [Actinoplanes deccanensis]